MDSILWWNVERSKGLCPILPIKSLKKSISHLNSWKLFYRNNIKGFTIAHKDFTHNSVCLVEMEKLYQLNKDDGSVVSTTLRLTERSIYHKISMFIAILQTKCFHHPITPEKIEHFLVSLSRAIFVTFLSVVSLCVFSS